MLAALITNIINIYDGEKNSLLVYPQPAKDFCYIKYSNALIETPSIQIFNSYGCVVNANEFSANNYPSNIIKLNTSELGKGIYFIQLKAGQSYFMEKLIIN